MVVLCKISQGRGTRERGRRLHRYVKSLSGEFTHEACLGHWRKNMFLSHLAAGAKESVGQGRMDGVPGRAMPREGESAF